MRLNDYSIAVIANENVKHFLGYLIESLKNLNFNFSNFYLGDAGLINYKNKVGLNIIQLPNKNYGVFKTQSLEYRDVIRNRPWFLEKVFNIVKHGGVLQLDADTYVVKDDFSLIDSEADLTLCVREVVQGEFVKKFSYMKNRYPNCGVVFWNHIDSCMEVIYRWGYLIDEVEPSGGQYEQNIFLHLMLEEEFEKLHVQEIHCRHYNCYKEEWFKYNPSIIHFKGGNARTADFKNPRSNFLKYCRRGRK